MFLWQVKLTKTISELLLILLHNWSSVTDRKGFGVTNGYFSVLSSFKIWLMSA